MRSVSYKNDGSVSRILMDHPLFRDKGKLWNSCVSLKEEYDRLHAERLNLHAIRNELVVNLGDDAMAALPSPVSGNLQVSD